MMICPSIDMLYVDRCGQLVDFSRVLERASSSSQSRPLPQDEKSAQVATGTTQRPRMKRERANDSAYFPTWGLSHHRQPI